MKKISKAIEVKLRQMHATCSSHTDARTYMNINLPTCLPTYAHADTHTHTNASIHTYIRTYVGTYAHQTARQRDRQPKQHLAKCFEDLMLCRHVLGSRYNRKGVLTSTFLCLLRGSCGWSQCCPLRSWASGPSQTQKLTKPLSTFGKPSSKNRASSAVVVSSWSTF